MSSIAGLSALLFTFAGAVIGMMFAFLWARGTAATGRAVKLRDAERLNDLQVLFDTAKASQRELEQTLAVRSQELSDLRVAAATSASELSGQRDVIASVREELVTERVVRNGLIDEKNKLGSLLATAETALRNEKENAAERLADLRNAKEQLSDQFSKLANEILEKKSQAFTEQNKVSLGHLLDPLKTQLTDFKGTVERVYVEEGEKRVALAEQVKQLAALNTQLSNDAIGLTNALKGSSKAQGNWGEIVLERILEAGGLRKGHEYRVQESFTREDGARVIPDVILHLPEGKHLVIDAKVSLLDYNEHVNGQADADRERAAASHIASMRTHIKGLSEKDYRSLHSLHTVDFVIMFVPIEPAFMLGIGRDPNLWTHAWEKNVLLVSPSTLLFVVRTVSHLWKQEEQGLNVKRIASKGGELYDKFAAFVSDLSKLGEQLNRAKESYDAAFNKLSSGRGNLIHQAEALYKLRVPAKKRLSKELIGPAAESAGDEIEDAEGDELASPASGPLLLDLAATVSDRPEE